MRFLLATLAVTPLARFSRFPKIIAVRRMLGLATLFYALAHLGLYVADQGFDLVRVASEIVRRVYLTIGFVAILGLAALGVTSTDAMIRRMGRNWTRLHALIYAITILGLLHYFMQVKIDASQPAFHAGLFVVLIGLRLALRLKAPPTVGTALVVALAAAPLTAGLEAGWYALATGVDPLRVLGANLAVDLDVGLRPALLTLIAGVAFALLAAGLAAVRGAPSPRPRKAAPG
ncbi:Sulfoxide reductase heme-binding subunit YedZ [Methylobrevis pamukkalensis]|uniref:Sulfoxide reductase heme-binding subunit YedZ n=1 Tax=Methylobrevis pamukkalensis TaxID=1439726 RepID=A0A1E3H5C0_9HYPH|nr:Sulfoxide reductase heme-binding subunit YedZ [Methylobrevis pamukkalensis]